MEIPTDIGFYFWAFYTIQFDFLSEIGFDIILEYSDTRGASSSGDCGWSLEKRMPSGITIPFAQT